MQTIMVTILLSIHGKLYMADGCRWNQSIDTSQSARKADGTNLHQPC